MPRFLEAEPAYRGEVTADRMGVLLAETRKRGWREALLRLEGEDPAAWRRVREKLTEARIANWSVYVPLGEGAVALDLGAGLGTMALALASRGFEVWAAGRVFERSLFISLRDAESYFFHALRGRGGTGPRGLVARAFHEALIRTGLSSWAVSSFLLIARSR